MFENLLDRINRGTWQRVLSFFILWFAIYGAVWTILEPLSISIPDIKIPLWRLLFISCTFVITLFIFFLTLFKKILERFGLEAGDVDLIKNLNTSGSPKISIQNDGFHGRLYNITANYSDDPMDWNVKASANKAKYLTFT